MTRLILLVGLALTLGGCMSNLKEIGRNPALSEVGDGLAADGPIEEPVVYASAPTNAAFSTWNNRQGDLFKDKLAMKPGDILTVDVSINDRAKFNNQSDSNRTVGRNIGLSGDWTVRSLGNDGDANANVNSTSNFSGDGGTNRSESIELSVAAVVTRVLPNGNLIVRGSQEVRLNAELRILTIAGIVRPTDIGPNNTISYERIAEARVSYGGRGHISNMQRPPYGQQILNTVLPF
ncbi:MAG: flagellar basal body L-ring protein FlgH [Rhizobiaceae bacterium]